MDYQKELDTVQRWIKSTAGLNSWRRTGAPPKLPRPVIVWESPHRGRDRNLSRYTYVQKITYYGKLYVNSLDEALDLQERLLQDLEDRCGLLEVIDDNGEHLAWLKDTTVTFTDTVGLDIPFNVSYKATYARKRPETPPPADVVRQTGHVDGGTIIQERG